MKTTRFGLGEEKNNIAVPVAQGAFTIKEDPSLTAASNDFRRGLSARMPIAELKTLHDHLHEMLKSSNATLFNLASTAAQRVYDTIQKQVAADENRAPRPCRLAFGQPVDDGDLTPILNAKSAQAFIDTHATPSVRNFFRKMVEAARKTAETATQLKEADDTFKEQYKNGVVVPAWAAFYKLSNDTIYQSASAIYEAGKELQKSSDSSKSGSPLSKANLRLPLAKVGAVFHYIDTHLVHRGNRHEQHL